MVRVVRMHVATFGKGRQMNMYIAVAVTIITSPIPTFV